MTKLDHAITIKVTDDMAAQIKGIAALEGMESGSEWIRHVLAREVQVLKQKRDALNAIFDTTNGEQKVIHDSRGLPASPFHGPRT